MEKLASEVFNYINRSKTRKAEKIIERLDAAQEELEEAIAKRDAIKQELGDWICPHDVGTVTLSCGRGRCKYHTVEITKITANPNDEGQYTWKVFAQVLQDGVKTKTRVDWRCKDQVDRDERRSKGGFNGPRKMRGSKPIRHDGNY